MVANDPHERISSRFSHCFGIQVGAPRHGIDHLNLCHKEMRLHHTLSTGLAPEASVMKPFCKQFAAFGTLGMLRRQAAQLGFQVIPVENG